MQAQPWRVNLTQNALAQTFCDQAYQNNPAFLAFLQRSGLPFQSESEFTAPRFWSAATCSVDVWVELHPLTPFATVHLKQELEALLQRPVDLVRLRERMNPDLRQAILREGVSASASMAFTTQVGETEGLMHAPPALVP